LSAFLRFSAFGACPTGSGRLCVIFVFFSGFLPFQLAAAATSLFLDSSKAEYTAPDLSSFFGTARYPVIARRR